MTPPLQRFLFRTFGPEEGPALWQVHDAVSGRLVAESAIIDGYERSHEGTAHAWRDARNLTALLHETAPVPVPRAAPAEELVPV